MMTASLRPDNGRDRSSKSFEKVMEDRFFYTIGNFVYYRIKNKYAYSRAAKYVAYATALDAREFRVAKFYF